VLIFIIDEKQLLEASTFLDSRRPFNTESDKGRAQVDVRYYPGESLWTPCPCFSENSYPYVLHIICLVIKAYQDMARSKNVTKSKKFIQGISGQKHQETPGDYAKRRVKLFSTIVNNNANINAKRSLSTEATQYMKMGSRGTAVAIGPLEYCGSGIALTPTNGDIL